ncbi:MAG: ribosomal L7Ae/L30e/S12e/Gadd45 family protein [Clostridia bacterium]|nr:ribosomal L7Ae/L30e/S12e/Gadd45 family protein [Clostridia bacterium]
MTDKILGMTGLAVRAGKVKFGVFLTLAACDEGKAKLVIMPSDIGASNRRSIEAKCKNTNIPCIAVSDKANLSRAVGKKDVTALAICDENFKSAILKLYGGGING